MKDEYKFLDQLPIIKRNEIFKNIHFNLSEKIKMLKELSLDIFIEMFKDLKLFG